MVGRRLGNIYGLRAFSQAVLPEWGYEGYGIKVIYNADTKGIHDTCLLIELNYRTTIPASAEHRYYRQCLATNWHITPHDRQAQTDTQTHRHHNATQ